MGDKSPFPTCKTCGKPHRGTCANPETGGYLSQRVGIIAHVDHRKTSLTAAITKIVADNPDALSVGKEPRITAGPRAPDTGAAAVKAVARGPGAANGATKKRGRPRIVEDRKAYLAQKAKERRARNKGKPDA